MLEQMRRSSQSLLIYLLFGVIVVVFVFSFGPQAQSGCESGGLGSNFAARVGDATLSQNDFRYGFLLVGGSQYPTQVARQRRLKETVMDELIKRELLAEEAERMGFRVSEHEVEDMLLEAKIVGLGFEQTVPSMQKDGRFDYELFKRFVQFQLAMTPKAFIEEQRRELLANRARQVLRGSVNVSPEEVKDDFVRKNNQVNVEYVRFPVRRYEAEVEPTPEEVKAFSDKNETKLKETYTQRKFLYEKAPKERKLRQLLVKLDPGATPEATAAAQKKADELAGRLKKGEPFEKVASAASDDPRTKAKGGLLGWRREGATTLGPENEAKVWAAKDGEVVGPLKATDGFYLVAAEGTREGDISFEQVRLELAEEQLRAERAKEKARADADAAIAKAKGAKDKALKDLFPATPDKLAGADAKPSAEETGLFARRGTAVEGIGSSPELAKAVFDLSAEQPFAGPIEVSGSYVVVKLKERKQADLAEFEKKKAELMTEAAAMKGEGVLEEWAMRRCQEAKGAKDITVNREILRYDDSTDPVPYEPCTPPLRLF
jgi:peptidyl-prolyl cis-trans isomerase D